jgi:hypothetical protein
LRRYVTEITNDAVMVYDGTVINNHTTANLCGRGYYAMRREKAALTDSSKRCNTGHRVNHSCELALHSIGFSLASDCISDCHMYLRIKSQRFARSDYGNARQEFADTALPVAISGNHAGPHTLPQSCICNNATMTAGSDDDECPLHGVILSNY